MPLSEAQKETRRYLIERYGVEDATLMMSLYELESDFGRVQTNDVSSASGQFQITKGTWASISDHIKKRIRQGSLSLDDLPDGMNLRNIDDFEMHRFDFVDNAFFANQNMNRIEGRYIARANRARAKNGQPPVTSFSELTDDPAMRMFMIAGGHKDGPDIGRNGAGFGNMINPSTGEIDVDYGMDRYALARSKGTGNDGKGHVFTYAAYASDKAIESIGGKKLQFTPSQIQKGLQWRYNRRLTHKDTKPWLDRAQQMDPGIDPDSMTEDQIYDRMDLFDDSDAYGANDVRSTDTHEVANDPAYKREGAQDVAINEKRRFSDDPVVAAEQQAAVAGRARSPEELSASQTTNIIGDTTDTQASGDPDAGLEPPASESDNYTGVRKITREGNPLARTTPEGTDERAREASRGTLTNALEEAREQLRQAQNPSAPTIYDRRPEVDPAQVKAAEEAVAAAEEALEELDRQDITPREGAEPSGEGPVTSGPPSRGSLGQEKRDFERTARASAADATAIEEEEAHSHNVDEFARLRLEAVNQAIEDERNEQLGLTNNAVADAEAEYNKIRQERREDQLINLVGDTPFRSPSEAIRTSLADTQTENPLLLSKKQLQGSFDFNRAQADTKADRITAGNRVLSDLAKGNGDLNKQISRSLGTDYDAQDEQARISDLYYERDILNNNEVGKKILYDTARGINFNPDITGINDAAKKLLQQQGYADYMVRQSRNR